MSIWLSQGFNAVSLGSILLLIAIGLTFSFGLMNAGLGNWLPPPVRDGASHLCHTADV